jgi:hypothetical protein
VLGQKLPIASKKPWKSQKQFNFLNTPQKELTPCSFTRESNDLSLFGRNFGLRYLRAIVRCLTRPRRPMRVWPELPSREIQEALRPPAGRFFVAGTRSFPGIPGIQQSEWRIT